jgi:hypothetical protein
MSPGRVDTTNETPNPRMVPIEDSIAGMIQVFEQFTLKQNGRSFRYNGSESTLK